MMSLLQGAASSSSRGGASTDSTALWCNMFNGVSGILLPYLAPLTLVELLSRELCQMLVITIQHIAQLILPAIVTAHPINIVQNLVNRITSGEFFKSMENLIFIQVAPVDFITKTDVFPNLVTAIPASQLVDSERCSLPFTQQLLLCFLVEFSRESLRRQTEHAQCASQHGGAGLEQA